MNKKRILLIFVILPALILSGCAPVVDQSEIPENFTIYASFLPVYMLADMIVDENIPGMNLHLLIQPQDGCMRSYALSDWDAYLSMNADCVILIGNGFESFESTLMSMGESGPSVISASSSLVLDSSGVSEIEGSHFAGANPWLFLSADGGLSLTEAIAANMIALDPDYEQAYMKNLKNAYDAFDALKSEFEAIAGKLDNKKPVALMHEGLIYPAKDFGLNVVLRIERESGEYPDGGYIEDILQELDESGVQAVLIEKQAPDMLVRALTEAGYEVALMDTLSAGDASNGFESYFERMLENARTIEKTFLK